MILAIDQWNIESGYLVLNENLKSIDRGKIKNEELLNYMYDNRFSNVEHFTIEIVASYGMAVGVTVFETCVWIGRFRRVQ